MEGGAASGAFAWGVGSACGALAAGAAFSGGCAREAEGGAIPFRLGRGLGGAQEASLLLLAAKPHSWKAVFEGKEAQLPSTAGASSQEAALEKQAKARLPVFEAEPDSPTRALTEGKRGNSPLLQAELRSRKNAPVEEVRALVPVLAADLRALS